MLPFVDAYHLVLNASQNIVQEHQTNLGLFAQPDDPFPGFLRDVGDRKQDHADIVFLNQTGNFAAGPKHPTLPNTQAEFCGVIIHHANHGKGAGVGGMSEQGLGDLAACPGTQN